MKKDFTLVELIVAILIVGILASVMILLMRGRIDKAKWSDPNYQGYSEIEGTPGLPFKNLPAVGSQNVILGSDGFIGPRIQQPNIAPAGATSQPQPQLDPFKIVENNFQVAQRSLFNYFDQARYDLDQQTLDPKQYLQQVDALHENTRRAEFALRQKADGQIESMGQIVKLMKEKRLDVNTGQRALYRLAGVDEEVIDSMFPQPKVTDPD
jgi:prepilin-type N-terminal cleavage/methylation domain-containing protein